MATYLGQVNFLLLRFLSTLTSQQMPLAARGLAVSKDQSREFMACFPDIVRDLTETGKHIDVPEASKWLAKVRSMLFLSVGRQNNVEPLVKQLIKLEWNISYFILCRSQNIMGRVRLIEIETTNGTSVP